MAKHRALLAAGDAAAPAPRGPRSQRRVRHPFRALHPAPDEVGPYVFEDWTEERLPVELEAILHPQDRKLQVVASTA